MRRLARVPGAWRGSEADEAGVVTILVVVSLVVIMAMGALVIDVGAMVEERRQLQNGADAAAMSVAHSCALGEVACGSPVASATALAGFNAGDGAAAIESAAVDSLTRTVTVRTRTLTTGGGSVLPFNFAGGGKTIHATAVATWGSPGHATTLPLTLSKCEFDKVALGATTVVFHTNAAGTCNEGPAGKDLPGGFGWLDMASGASCSVAIDAGGNASANTGVSAPGSCNLSALLGKTLLVPIFDNAVKTGTNVTYHIAGFGAFVLTGYRFPSISGGSPVPCKSPNTCIGGTFTKFVTDAGGLGGGDFGTYVIKLVK